MARISKKIEINAPVERVFDIVTNPENWPLFVSGLIEVRNLQPCVVTKGATFTWEYNLLGKRTTGSGEMTEYEKNKKCALALTGEFSMKESYEFIESPEGTELRVDLEYGPPSGEVSRPREKMLEKVNEIDAGTILEKIRILSEEKALMT